MLTRLCLLSICGAVMTYSWAQNGSNSGSGSLIALQLVKHIVIRSLQVILTCSWLLPDFSSIAPSRWPFMLGALRAPLLHYLYFTVLGRFFGRTHSNHLNHPICQGTDEVTP
jgi:hypothetical protein